MTQNTIWGSNLYLFSASTFASLDAVFKVQVFTLKVGILNVYLLVMYGSGIVGQGPQEKGCLRCFFTGGFASAN